MITALPSTASGLILIKLLYQRFSLILFSLPRALASFTTHNLVLSGFFAQYSLILFLLLQLFLPFSLSSPAHVVFVSLASLSLLPSFLAAIQPQHFKNLRDVFNSPSRLTTLSLSLLFLGHSPTTQPGYCPGLGLCAPHPALLEDCFR